MTKKTPSKLFYLALIMLSIGGLISTEIYITSFKAMSDYYEVDISNIQSSIPVFLLALSISQLIYGPISDFLGRKLVLVIGITIWCLTSLSICFSTHIDQLIFLRMLQGVGACAGMTVSRAIIADTFSKEEGYKIYLTIFPFVGMSPALAPMIGRTLHNYFGWKSNFIFIFIFASIALLLTFVIIEESLNKQQRKKVKLSHFINNLCSTFKNKNFIYYSMIPCFGYAVYFAYITDATIILMKYGVKKEYLGNYFLTLSLTYVLGNIYARKLINSMNVEKTIFIGYIFFTLGSFLFLLTTRMIVVNEILLIASISIVTFGNGFLLPLGTSRAISSSNELSGTASGVIGSLQLGSAAISSYIVSSMIGENVIKLGNFIVILSIIAFCLFYNKYKRNNYD